MEAARDLAGRGAQVAGSAADAARRAAIVVTMVTDADAVILIARDQGMLAALGPGAIWAQMSTIGVAGIDAVAALARAERPDVMLLQAAERDITMRAVQVVRDGRRLGALIQLLAQGVLTVSAGDRLPLERAAPALARARHGAHGSAIVLRTGNPG